jgi:hypothetical protein
MAEQKTTVAWESDTAEVPVEQQTHISKIFAKAEEAPLARFPSSKGSLTQGRESTNRIRLADYLPSSAHNGVWSRVPHPKVQSAAENFRTGRPDAPPVNRFVIQVGKHESHPRAGAFNPISRIAICRSAQASFFWRGSRSKNAG